MKNRNIPFGYEYQNGSVVVNSKEAEILKAIFEAYTEGQSLRIIAQRLNEKNIEYMPGVLMWNKARIMRMIEDERYTGTSIYPMIVDTSAYERIQKIKASKNSQKDTDRTSDIYKLKVPVICSQCGSEMHRRQNIRCKCQNRWICKNDICKTTIKIADCNLLHQTTELLNVVIDDPERIQVPTLTKIESNMEQKRLENEIVRTLEGYSFDRESLKQKMLQYVTLQYSEIPNDTYNYRRLKLIFEQASPVASFSAELVDKAVQKIRLHTDGTVSIVLINGQEIRKEQTGYAIRHGANRKTQGR